MPNEIFRGVVICTSHVTDSERAFLDEARLDEVPMLLLRGEHGWFIHITRRDDEDDNRIVPRDLDSERLPGLSAISKWAAENGYEYVLLDSCADTIDELPTYEW